MSIGTASTTAATDGIAITALQNVEHATGATPFSSPAQPSHFPDIGMSLDIGMSFAADMADLTTMSGAAKPCTTSPAVKTRAVSKADIRRILHHNILRP